MKAIIHLSLEAHEQDRTCVVVDANGEKVELSATAGQAVVSLDGADSPFQLVVTPAAEADPSPTAKRKSARQARSA